MKTLISNTIAKWFKSLGFAGAFRFKALYWAYRITGWHIRHREWDFVLDYLPPLMKGQVVTVLDVGAARTLFIHELRRRKYCVVGLDLNPYQEKFEPFIVGDVRKLSLGYTVDFIICISVLEHIEEEQALAIYRMIDALKFGGRLLLTIPTHEFAQGHPWHGFTKKELEAMLPKEAEIFEYAERMGQICACIGKVA